MKKNFIFLILLVFPFKALSHTDHYKNINKIEMEILKDGKDQANDLRNNLLKNNFLIHGSSYKGNASLNNVIGNWWNHKILESDSQISPLSGSIKKQTVTFIAEEKIELYGKEYLTHKFKLKSKDLNISEDKKLDFDIWFEPKSSLILKVGYEKMGYWEYKLKNLK